MKNFKLFRENRKQKKNQYLIEWKQKMCQTMKKRDKRDIENFVKDDADSAFECLRNKNFLFCGSERKEWIKFAYFFDILDIHRHSNQIKSNYR